LKPHRRHPPHLPLLRRNADDRKYVGSSYGYNYRVDYYRSLSPEERAAQQAQLKEALEGNYIMELMVYAPNLAGDPKGMPQARGFKYYLGGTSELGMLGDLSSVWQIAFVMSHMAVDNVRFKAGEGPGSDVDALGATGKHLGSVYYSNIGLMLRAVVPLTRYMEGFGQWDANVLSLFDTSGKKLKSDGYLWTSSLRVGVTLNATDRLYVKGYGSLNGFGDYGLGAQAEAGLRF